MNRFAVLLALTLPVSIIGGCEAYDPPPTVELRVPDDGKWVEDTPLVLEFSETVDRSSFRFTIWPYEYDSEGEISSEATPLVSDCHQDASSCGGISIGFNDASDVVTLTHGDLFKDKTGVPFILEVHAGLKDPQGRERKVPTIFEFQINPSQSGGAVDPNFNSDVMLLVADLTDTIPGIYLRLYVDLVVDKDTGKTWILGTVASINQSLGFPPDTTDPAAMELYDDYQGWALDMQGTLTEVSDGKYFIDTEPRDVTVLVLGVIWVQLKDFRLEATIAPGSGADGRDSATGLLTASKALINGPDDPDDIGEVAAALTMTGIFKDEIAEELPQLCEEDPCEHMNAAGGDCQLTEPWEKVPPCP